MKESEFTNYNICKSCGGACCTNCAGSFIPTDFSESITKEFLENLLDGGKHAIDWWEGDTRKNPGDEGRRGRTFYIRPRHVGEAAICGSWGGTCVNWSSSTGCSLTFEARPFQCRALVPKKEKGELHCAAKNAGKLECADAWYDYQHIFEEIINERKTDETKPDGLGRLINMLKML